MASERAEGFLGYWAGSYDVTFSLHATQVSKLNIQCVIMAGRFLCLLKHLSEVSITKSSESDIIAINSRFFWNACLQCEFVIQDFGVTVEYPATRTNFCVASYAVRSK